MDLTAPSAPSAAPDGADVATADRSALDVGRIEPDGQPVRQLTHLTGPREPGFAVVIQRSVLNSIHAHGKSDTSVEICGVIVGNLHHDRISPYILISAHIPGDKAASKQTQVTFTADTWNAIQVQMEKNYSGLKVVGWYHTHPGFGVFLSGMDLFIQDNFFNLPWQVAWVYDPIAGADGAFIWKSGKSERTEFLIEEDVALTPSPAEGELAAVPRSSLRTVLTIIVAFMLVFLLTWFGLIWLTNHGARVRLPIEW